MPVGWGEAAPLHGALGSSRQRHRADGKHSSSGTSHGPAEALPRLQADLRGCSNHMTASVHRAPCTRSRACRKSSARQMSCSVSTRSSSSALFVSLAGPASHACSSSCVKARALILRCVEHCLYVLYSSQDRFSGRLWHLRYESCLQTYQSSAQSALLTEQLAMLPRQLPQYPWCCHDQPCIAHKPSHTSSCPSCVLHAHMHNRGLAVLLQVRHGRTRHRTHTALSAVCCEDHLIAQDLPAA